MKRLIVAMSCLVACTPSRKDSEDRAPSTFFPPGSLGPQHEFQEKWFGKHLRALGESPLKTPPEGTLVVRFLWLRSFHSPIVVRLTKTSSWHLVAKQSDGHGGYEPGKVSAKVDRALTSEEAAVLEAELHGVGIWDYPEQTGTSGADGARWVLEAAQGNRYNVVNYWSPEDDPIYDFGVHLLGLTGFDIEPIY